MPEQRLKRQCVDIRRFKEMSFAPHPYPDKSGLLRWDWALESLLLLWDWLVESSILHWDWLVVSYTYCAGIG